MCSNVILLHNFYIKEKINMKSSLQILNEGFLKKYLVEDVEEEETDEIEVGDLFTKGDETYKLLDVQIDEEGNVVVEAENQETEKPEEIEYISKEEAEENTEDEIATDDYKEDAEEAEFEKSLEVEDDDEETKEVKDECLTEGEIGRTAGTALGSKFGIPELGGKIGSTIEDTAVDAFKVYRDTYGLSNREALLRLARLAADKISSRFPLKDSDLAFECVDFRKLRECAKNLKEAQMSPEDEKDSEILRNIYNKSLKRKNARLTPEEKAVMDKFGLKRADWDGTPVKPLDPDKPYSQTAPIVKGKETQRYNRWNSTSGDITNDKINLADRARKINQRGSGYEANNVYSYGDPSREFKRDGKYVTIKDKGLLDKERALQNDRMQDTYNSMKVALQDRKYHQKNLDNIDAEYDKKRAEIQAYLDKLTRDQERDKQYYSKARADSQGRIDKLLRRNESLSEELLDRDVNDFNSDVYNALARVMQKWDRKGIQPSEEDMDKAYEWFSLHFYTSDDWYL